MRDFGAWRTNAASDEWFSRTFYVGRALKNECVSRRRRIALLLGFTKCGELFCARSIPLSMKTILGLGLLLVVAGAWLTWRMSQHSSPNQVAANVSTRTTDALKTGSAFHRTAAKFPPPLDTARAPAKDTYQRLLSGDKSALHVSPETIEAYLRSNNFSAQSLLAAFQITTNREYLLMAATNHPHDPQVQLAVLAHDALPLQRSEWLARFKKDAPDNALPGYLAARDAFKAQQPQLALRELADAAGKQRFRDYTVEKMQALEEVYLADGRFPGEAKVAGMATVLLPHLKELRDLAGDITALQQRYAAGADQRTADVLAGDTVRLARQLNSADSASLLTQLVGVSIEANALKNYPADTTPPFLKVRAEDRLAELKQEREAVRDASKYLDGWIRTANEAEVVTYFDRAKLFGEFAALEWLRNRSPAP
jgi:hypothetical protein